MYILHHNPALPASSAPDSGLAAASKYQSTWSFHAAHSGTLQQQQSFVHGYTPMAYGASWHELQLLDFAPETLDQQMLIQSQQQQLANLQQELQQQQANLSAEHQAKEFFFHSQQQQLAQLQQQRKQHHLQQQARPPSPPQKYRALNTDKHNIESPSQESDAVGFAASPSVACSPILGWQVYDASPEQLQKLEKILCLSILSATHLLVDWAGQPHTEHSTIKSRLDNEIIIEQTRIDKRRTRHVDRPEPRKGGPQSWLGSLHSFWHSLETWTATSIGACSLCSATSDQSLTEMSAARPARYCASGSELGDFISKAVTRSCSSWLLLTCPPEGATAQVGGAHSPLNGFCHVVQTCTNDCDGIFLSPSQGPSRPRVPLHPAAGVEDPLLPNELRTLPAQEHTSICSIKGNKETAPNQDRAAYAHLNGGAITLIAVLDGHGEFGHTAANIACDVLMRLFIQALTDTDRELFFGSNNFRGVCSNGNSRMVDQSNYARPQNPQEADHDSTNLPDALTAGARAQETIGGVFTQTHSYLESITCSTLLPKADCSSRTPHLDARVSGTTATVVAVFHRALIVANVGDSRAVLGIRKKFDSSPGSWRTIELTRDHKPELEEERARIEAAGASVQLYGTPPNTTSRIYTPQQTWPVINMTRSLGDLHAHTQGLVPVADVRLYEHLWDPESEEAVVIVGSDGIWDVISNLDAVTVVARAQEMWEDPAQTLVADAYDRWLRRGLPQGYTDDITVVVKFI